MLPLFMRPFFLMAITLTLSPLLPPSRYVDAMRCAADAFMAQRLFLRHFAFRLMPFFATLIFFAATLMPLRCRLSFLPPLIFAISP